MARPGFLRRFRDAFSFAMRWSSAGGSVSGMGWYGSRFYGSLPGSLYNLGREVGDPAQNSAVAICLNWVADQFAEAPGQVATGKPDGTWTPVPNHPLADLIASPNDYYDGDALAASLLFSYLVDGNAYAVKARGMAGMGRPQNLWFIPHWQMEPRWDRTGNTFITHYDYMVDGQVTSLPREAVIHFFDKVDPIRRKGVSRLYPALRSVGADNEADTFVFAILKNMGIPGVLLSPKDPTITVETDAREELAQLWTEGFTGDNRGRPLVPNVALEVSQLAFSPEQLALDKIRDVPLQRICASLRVNPMVVGLGTGPGGLDSGGQHYETNRMAFQNGIVPLLKRFSRIWTRSLGPDFDLDEKQCFRYDTANVEALQEDKDLVAKRARDNFSVGIWTRAESRSTTGQGGDPADDVFMVPKGASLVHRGATPEDVAEMNKPPAPPPGGSPGGPPGSSPDDDEEA